MLHGLTGRHTYGVLPFRHGLGIDEEDGLRVSLRGAVRESVVAPPVGEDVLRVAVCAVPLMSNFTDVDALAAEPGVVVRFVDRPEELADADLVVVPGTRGTVRALAWLRERGLADALARRAAEGRPGARHLRRVPDARRAHRGRGRVARRASSTGSGCCPYGCGSPARRPSPGPSARRSASASRATRSITASPKCRRRGSSPTTAFLDGCRVGAVWGTHWHGSLESDGFRRAFLREVAGRRGPPLRARARHRLRRAARGAAGPARRPDRRARGHGRAVRLIESGAPPGLPFVPPGAPWHLSTVLLLSTADTDLLAARASGAPYRIGNPTRVDVDGGAARAARRARTSPSCGCSAANGPGRTGSRRSRRPGSRPCCWAARPCPTRS